MYAAVFLCSIALADCFATIDPTPYETLQECESAMPNVMDLASIVLEKGLIPVATDYEIKECCSVEEYDTSKDGSSARNGSGNSGPTS